MAVDPFFIIVNSSGSDTGASGCGPSVAVSGSGASVTSGSATVDLSADSPDLSAVQADDLLWVGTSSGRQFTRVLAVDNSAKTITTTAINLYSVTESGRNWGIGGKRATLSGLDNFMLYRNVASFSGDLSYYGIAIENDQTITSRFPSADSNHQVTNVIKGVGSTRPKIICSQPAGTPAFRTGWSNTAQWNFYNLEFVNTNNSSTDEFISVYGSAASFTAINCKFGLPGDENIFISDGHLRMTIIDCTVHCSKIASVSEVTSSPHYFYGCAFFGNGAAVGIFQRSTFYIDSCVFANFTDCFSSYAQLSQFYVTNCIFDNISGSVYKDTSGSLNTGFRLQHNNIYSNCGKVYDFPTTSLTTNLQSLVQYDGPIKRKNNNYWNCTAIGASLNDTETQINPDYKDASSLDYTVQNPSLLTGGGYPNALGYEALSSVGPNTGIIGSTLHPLYATGRK